MDLHHTATYPAAIKPQTVSALLKQDEGGIFVCQLDITEK